MTTQQNGPWNNYGHPTSPEWKDAAGKDIAVGDIIVYTVTVGRSSAMKFGVVTDLTSKAVKRHVSSGPPQHSWINIDTFECKIKVVSSYRGMLNRNGGKQSLERLDVVLVINEDQVPAADIEQIRFKVPKP